MSSLDVLGALMMLWIIREVNRASVIQAQLHRSIRDETKFAEKSTKVKCLFGRLGGGRDPFEKTRLVEICILTESRSKRPFMAPGKAEKTPEKLTPLFADPPLIFPTEQGPPGQPGWAH